MDNDSSFTDSFANGAVLGIVSMILWVVINLR